MDATVSPSTSQPELLAEVLQRLEELEAKVVELELQIQSLRSEA
jgi:chaperonin cofactor prefoldin